MSKGEKKSAASIVIPAIVIGLIVWNIYSIHKFTYTVATWASYWKVVLIGGSILLPLFFYISLGLLKDHSIAERIWKPIATTYGFYMVFIGFIPFHINAITGEPENKQDIDCYAGWEVTIDHRGHSPFESTTYEYDFYYKGIDFTEDSYNPSGNSVEIYTSVGWFGWEYIDEVVVY